MARYAAHRIITDCRVLYSTQYPANKGPKCGILGPVQKNVV